MAISIQNERMIRFFLYPKANLKNQEAHVLNISKNIIQTH